MMWSSIANLKENLNKIALDVHDDDLDIYNSPNSEDSSVSDRRISHSLAHSKSSSHSPIANGFDSAYNLEIDQFKSEIKRLQESEAEIKALSVNYAALLKEKEDHISRLNEENGSLKKNLAATNSALRASRDEISKTLMNSPISESGDQSPNRQNKAIMKKHPIGNQAYNGIISKRDRLNNGIAHSVRSDVDHSSMESNSSNMQDNEKVLADLLEEKNKSLREIYATYEWELKELRLKLEKECNKLADTQLKLQDEQKLNGAFQVELESLKLDKDKTNSEMKKISKELNEKISEVRELQMELKRKEDNKADDVVKDLKRVIAVLEEENSNLKKLRTLGSFSEKEELNLSLQKLEQDLKKACRERDKALQELNRLKQHLLDKESEESEKMDEDSKIIEELRENNEYLKAQNLHLEKALKQAVAGQEEVKIINGNELQKSREIINDLNKKLASYMSTIDAKNTELLNLQTALGQYYAEIEAKERLEGDLALVREESAKLSELLKGANQQLEISKREKDELWVKLSEAERMLTEGKNRVNKLEENNLKLRHALEQSMTRLNRMSVDSDFFVDRRIVIKLLVTYFQRNHSKEVLDLMVRMLGFSDEDKQRIGVAQHGGGKGVVRGVLGLPGRLVGGILGGSSAEARATAASENQSFADMWVDFLLKETEERDRRESAEALGRSNKENHGMRPDSSAVAEPEPNFKTDATAGFSGLNRLMNQNHSPLSYNGKTLQPECSVSEFATVPLTSSESSSRISKLLPKY